MDVEIKTVNRKPIAYVRHIGPYEKCETAWNGLCAWAAPKGLLNEHTEMFGIGYDDPAQTPAQELRYDACITLDTTPEVKGNVKLGELPAGEYATKLHSGPYEELGQSWTTFFHTELPQSGHEYDQQRPSFEQYLNDPSTTPPQDLKTILFIPVK